MGIADDPPTVQPTGEKRMDSRLFSGALVTCLLAGCAPMTVHHDYDPDVDFSLYRSFSWMPVPTQDEEAKSILSGPFLEKRIKKAVVENLTSKGFEKTTRDPDLLIAYHINFKNKTDVGVRRHGCGYWGHRAVDVRRYKEGTLILDFVDPESRELAWRGWSVSPIHPDSSPQEEQENLYRAVTEILKRYPPYDNPEGGKL